MPKPAIRHCLYALALLLASPAHLPAQTPAPGAASEPPRAAVYGYRVVHEYPHDPDAFTQGLIWQDGVLYESTGLYGHSSVRKVRLEDGQVLEKRDVASEFFGEGLTDWKEQLLQLTWTNEQAFIYDKNGFQPHGSFRYRGQGWGITHDDSRLIMSDGSAMLRFLDPQTYVETGSVEVRNNGRPVHNLNELEYIDGEVYANVWLTDVIARIDPKSGQVNGLIDLRGLLDPTLHQSNDQVLNGIAWDPQGHRLFVTGKRWPKLFEIELVRRR